jgi:two-component system sensor histidine kinase KdpD
MKKNVNDRYSYQGAIRGPLKNYAWSVLSIFAFTVFGYALTPYLDLTNIALLYLLPVLVSAVRWGRGPAFLASFLGVLAFNFFFVPPIFTFEVANVQHFFALVIFLLVALVTSTLATKLGDEMRKATEREQRTLVLYDLSREIAARTDLDQVLKTFVDKVADTINGVAIVLIHNEDANTLNQIASTGADGMFDEKEYAVARRVLEQGRPAGKGLGIFEGERSLFFFPVKVEDRTLAVLGVRPVHAASSLSPEQTQLVETLSNLAAVIIVRLQLAKEAEHAKWLAESEKLYRTLLNSISHDFRTPLAAIMGAVTSLIDEKDIYTPETREMFLNTIREEARRMNRFVENLLDMVRLESGTLKLNMRLCDIEDIIGVVLREMRDTLAGHPVSVDIPPDAPSVMADFILIEQVLINLLENAAKYSPPDVPVSISVSLREKDLIVTLANAGPPIPGGEREHIFDKFYRQGSSKHVSGTGLGLFICKGIIEAHGGHIWIEPSPEYGNRFSFSLTTSGELTEKENS